MSTTLPTNRPLTKRQLGPNDFKAVFQSANDVFIMESNNPMGAVTDDPSIYPEQYCAGNDPEYLARKERERKCLEDNSKEQQEQDDINNNSSQQKEQKEQSAVTGANENADASTLVPQLSHPEHSQGDSFPAPPGLPLPPLPPGVGNQE